MSFYIDRVPDRYFDWFAEGWRCFIRSDYGDVAGGSQHSAPMNGIVAGGRINLRQPGQLKFGPAD